MLIFHPESLFCANYSIYKLATAHRYLCILLFAIFLFVMYLLCVMLVKTAVSQFSFTKGSFLETSWTLAPGLFLFFFLWSALVLIYGLDDMAEHRAVVKLCGTQWAWEFSHGVKTLGMFLIKDDLADLDLGDLRSLQTDTSLSLQCQLYYKFLITSKDVIHSFAVPGLGVKVDAVPGRISQATVFSYIPGFFYGQCSEICGGDHGFMPVSLFFYH